jgi:hypothetical protein
MHGASPLAGAHARHKEVAMFTGNLLNVSRLFRRGFKLSYRAARAKTAHDARSESANLGSETVALILRDGAACVRAEGIDQMLHRTETLALFGLVDSTLLASAVQNAAMVDL